MKYEEVAIGSVVYVGRVRDGNISKLRRAKVKAKGAYVTYWGECGRAVKDVSDTRSDVKAIWVEIECRDTWRKGKTEEDVIAPRQIAMVKKDYDLRAALIEEDRARHLAARQEVQDKRAELLAKIKAELALSSASIFGRLELQHSTEYRNGRREVVPVLRLYGTLDVKTLKALGAGALFRELQTVKDPTC